MPSHVNSVVVPEAAPSLRLAPGGAHQRCTRAVNGRQGWVGHLWEGRFAPGALDGPHLIAAARHDELDLVRSRSVWRGTGRGAARGRIGPASQPW